MQDIKILVIDELSDEQKYDIFNLQKLTFAGVNDKEAEEDFYHPPSAQVLAYVGDELVGWAGIHETEQKFEGKRIRLGGYGVCTHPDWQRKGIASKVSQVAMRFLKEKGCEVAFLSVDPSNTASIKLHKKNGFIMLPRNFSWTNSKGEVKQDEGGMIALINSQKLFKYVLNGEAVLYVGNGYW